MYRLFARPGWGSVLVEAQLAWYGLPYEIEDLDDLFKSAEARERLRPVNPLAQVPTLVLPDGQILTESAAITLHLVDATQSADLVPASGEDCGPPFCGGSSFSWPISTRPSPTQTIPLASSRTTQRSRSSRRTSASIDRDCGGKSSR
jgi:hypothetical protein